MTLFASAVPGTFVGPSLHYAVDNYLLQPQDPKMEMYLCVDGPRDIEPMPRRDRGS